MLPGPETTRVLHQFEEEYLIDNDESIDRPNHEMGLAAQKTFKQQVTSLVYVIERMGNPFLDDFLELVRLDSRDCMDDQVVESIVNLEQLGKMQYQEYVKCVIIDRTTSISNPIKKNKLYLFGKQSVRAKSKQTKTITALQNNVRLFAQLYIAMQSRNADLEDFFSHEVQSFSATLSEFGSLHLPTAKSDLLKCIVKPHQSEPQVQFDARIFDGVVVHYTPYLSPV